MTENMKRIDWKDPLLWISIVLAITATVQTNTGMLSVLAEKHPLGFGLAMLSVSCVTAVLTALKGMASR